MYDEKEANNYHYIVLEIDEAVTSLSRDQLVDILKAENVLARRYFYPGCHNMEPYRSYFPLSSLWLQETERMAKRVLVLPTGAAVDADAIQTISRIIRLAVCHGREIRDLLQKQSLPLDRVTASPLDPATIKELEVARR
jgi:dTDP-4-amino-4,6-dideoxygalactose transaminase